MRKDKNQLIAEFGVEILEKIENAEYDFTNRLLPDPQNAEFSAHVEAKDMEGNLCLVCAYVFQTLDSLRECDDLSNLPWDPEEFDWQIEEYA